MAQADAPEPSFEHSANIFTRDAVITLLAEEIAASAGEKPISFILFDIDNFSPIAREYGRDAARAVLGYVAETIKANAPDKSLISHAGTLPLVGRMGKDSFACILPAVASEEAILSANEIRVRLEDSPVKAVSGGLAANVKLTVSAGVAAYPKDAKDPGELIRKADSALYKAKTDGKDRISLPPVERMATKTSHYTRSQLDRLAHLAAVLEKHEAALLREALDDLFIKYGDYV